MPLVVVGGSQGGMSVMKTILPGLSPGFSGQMAVVLHRAPTRHDIMGSMLQKFCAIPIEEAVDKANIRNGRVYLAPADYHLLIEENCFALSTDPPVTWARPSIDVLFESAAVARGASVVAILLSGASVDGAAGAAAVKARGGTVLVQAPETAESDIMPRSALASADRVLAPEALAQFLAGLTTASP